MQCPACSQINGDTAAFCIHCGGALVRATPMATSPGSGAAAAPAMNAPITSPSAAARLAQPEETAKRVVAYLIDLIPAAILALINLIPVIGWMIYGLVFCLYWLLRDVNGASLGKLAMGSIVVNADGQPSTTGQRIRRNLPLALPGLLGILPFVGVVLEIPVAMIVFTAEAIALLATGSRIGDRIAGTMVTRK